MADKRETAGAGKNDGENIVAVPNLSNASEIVKCIKEEINTWEAEINEKAKGREDWLLSLVDRAEASAKKVEEAEENVRKMRDEIAELVKELKELRAGERESREESTMEQVESQLPLIENDQNHDKSSQQNDEDAESENGDKRRPEPMTERELVWEMKERNSRRKNVSVKGVRTTGSRYGEETKTVLQKFLKIPFNYKEVRAIGGGLVFKLDRMEDKVNVMKRKSALRKTGIWIQEDYTERQRLVQEYIESVAELEKSHGKKVRVMYQSLLIEDKFFKWNEVTASLESKSLEKVPQRD